MKLKSYFLPKWVLVVNLVLAFTIVFSSGAQSEGRGRSYQSTCSFYGQNQPQAQSIGCSISQSSNQIIIRWDDGFTTTLNYSRDGGWRSMPSGSSADPRFYYGSGQVAHFEIYEGPGKGIIIVRP